MPTYHPNLPAGCPPPEAAVMTGPIYRKVSRPPATISNADFFSSREKGDRNPDRECQRWGISVWVEISHLNHDLDAFPYLKKYRFVSVAITPRHGVIQKTPSDDRP